MASTKLKTPRGEIVISDKTESELKLEGWGIAFWHEDWVIMTKDNYAVATKNEKL